MSIASWGWLVLSGLLLFCAGFAWGRRRGRVEGQRLGLLEAPLAWRQASLEAGHCLFCTPAGGWDKASGGGVKLDFPYKGKEV